MIWWTQGICSEMSDIEARVLINRFGLAGRRIGDLIEFLGREVFLRSKE